MIVRLAKVLPLLAALLLAACETAPPRVAFPDITFGHLPAFRLTVSKVEVDSRYHSPMAAPNVEHLVPASPEKALRQWAADRIKAGGQGGIARFVIVEASVKETPLETSKGIKGVFTKEQTARYEATAEASLEVLDTRGFRLGFASARVSRARTIREDASINDRDRLWFGLVDDLMKDFDREMEKNIRQYLGGYLL